MGDLYTKEFEIMTGMLDQHYRMKPTAAMEIFQEMALSHSHALNYTLEWFHKEKKGWMLLDWDIRFYNYPTCHEKVMAKTWTNMHRKIQAMRSFELYTEEKKLATALTRWVYMDIDRKRPIRVPDEMARNYSIGLPMAFETDCFLENIQACIPEDSQKESWKIHRRELDFNNHVNNIKYIEWAIDYVPEEIYTSFHIAEMKVSYKKECLLGDIVQGQFHTEEIAKGYRTYAQFYKNDIICCQIQIDWFQKK